MTRTPNLERQEWTLPGNVALTGTRTVLNTSASSRNVGFQSELLLPSSLLKALRLKLGSSTVGLVVVSPGKRILLLQQPVMILSDPGHQNSVLCSEIQTHTWRTPDCLKVLQRSNSSHFPPSRAP